MGGSPGGRDSCRGPTGSPVAPCGLCGIHPSTKIDEQMPFQCAIAKCFVEMERSLSELPNIHLHLCRIMSLCPLVRCCNKLFSQAALSKWRRDDEALQIAIAVGYRE